MTREVTVGEVRSRLLGRHEVALLDVREEGEFAKAHPLFAASLPSGRLELDAWDRIPRRDVPMVVYDDGEGLAAWAAERLAHLGYTDVMLLRGGLAAWRAAGVELFRDVNVPSKAFGELVEARRHTPSIPAAELHAKLAAGDDVVVLDARPFEEYRTMSIPTAISVPGAELVLRARQLAPDPRTLVVVNCAGRTRSIIGAQSLVNAAIPNRVAALRNGTIGWTLAGLPLDQGRAEVSARSTRPLPQKQPLPRAGLPSGPEPCASTGIRCGAGKRTANGRCTGSMCAPPRNMWPVTCRDSARHPVVSWSRRPTCSRPSEEPGSCWPTRMAPVPR